MLDWNVVPTGSMKPTIVEGDYILVNKLAFDLRLPLTGGRLLFWSDPKRVTAIVVFDPPGERDRYVKRIVGVPGDVLELRDNRLFVNGKPARYQELDPGQNAGRRPRDATPDNDCPGMETVAGRAHAVMLSPDSDSMTSFEPLVVPPGQYFVMGDNRDNSKDSRYFGFVSRDRIIGTLLCGISSLSRSRASQHSALGVASSGSRAELCRRTGLQPVGTDTTGCKPVLTTEGVREVVE